jgi:integral membrane protein
MQPYRVFRVTAIAEAFSWTGLLVGMYLKYIAEVTELGVFIFGRLHGALFVAYLAAALWIARAERWSFLRTGMALLASIPPLTTLIFERWLARRRTADAQARATEERLPATGAQAGVAEPVHETA